MAFGSGTWVTQNKKLPGSYINFVSSKGGSVVVSERGVAALPISLSWGASGVIELTSDKFYNNSLEILGYSYTDTNLKGLRDVFKNATKVYIYKLNNNGVKASNTYATAKYAGTRGNDLKIVIAKNVDDDTYFDVQTLLNNKEMDVQTVKTYADLKSNDWVDFDKTDASLSELTAGVPLSSGTDGTVTAGDWTNALSSLETYSFNVLGVVSTDDEIKSSVVAWTKRMREEKGIKFQTVLYKKDADYQGVINVVNKLVGETSDKETANVVYWVTGAEAGCAVNKSCTNKTYDGEYNIDVNYSQDELGDCIDKGQLVFHRVGDSIRVLTDINSLVNITDDCGEVFKANQTIRVVDQIGNDIANIFNNRFLGKVPNDEAGRISLQNEIVSHHKQLSDIRAIEDFEAEDVIVQKGNDKKSVLVTDNITVVNAMEKLYMTVIVG